MHWNDYVHIQSTIFFPKSERFLIWLNINFSEKNQISCSHDDECRQNTNLTISRRKKNDVDILKIIRKYYFGCNSWKLGRKPEHRVSSLRNLKGHQVHHDILNEMQVQTNKWFKDITVNIKMISNIETRIGLNLYRQKILLFNLFRADLIPLIVLEYKGNSSIYSK